MAQIYMGQDLYPTAYDTSFTYTATNGASAGDEFYTHLTMQNQNGYYKSGYVTVSTSFTGGNLNARTGSTISTASRSGQISGSTAFAFIANYLQPNNFIVVAIPQGIQEVFTITVRFQVITQRTATYNTYGTSFEYDGSPKTCVRSYTHSTMSGTNTATAKGNYTVYLEADGSSPYSDCYYFVDDFNRAYSLAEIEWSIVETNKYVPIYVNNTWRNAIPYIYSNGSFRKSTPKVWASGHWSDV